MVRLIITFIIFIKLALLLQYAVGDFSSLLKDKKSNSPKELHDLKKDAAEAFQRTNASKGPGTVDFGLTEESPLEAVLFSPESSSDLFADEPGPPQSWRKRRDKHQRRYLYRHPGVRPLHEAKAGEDEIFLDRPSVWNRRRGPEYSDDYGRKFDYYEGYDEDVDDDEYDRNEEDDENEKSYFGTFVEIGNNPDRGRAVAFENSSALAPYASNATRESDENLLPPFSLGGVRKAGADKLVAKNEGGNTGGEAEEKLNSEEVTRAANDEDNESEEEHTLMTDKYEVNSEEVDKADATEENATLKHVKGHRREHPKRKRLKQRSPDSYATTVGTRVEEITPLNSIISRPFNQASQFKSGFFITPESTIVEVEEEPADWGEETSNVTDGGGGGGKGVSKNRTASKGTWKAPEIRKNSEEVTFSYGEGPVKHSKRHADNVQVDGNVVPQSYIDEPVRDEANASLVDIGQSVGIVVGLNATRIGREAVIESEKLTDERFEDKGKKTVESNEESVRPYKRERHAVGLGSCPISVSIEGNRCKSSKLEGDTNIQQGLLNIPLASNKPTDPEGAQNRAHKTANSLITAILTKADKADMRKQLGLCKGPSSNTTQPGSGQASDAEMKNVMSCINNFMQDHGCRCIGLDSEMQSFLNWIMHGKSDMGCCLPGPEVKPPKTSFLFHENPHQLHLGSPCPSQQSPAMKAASVAPANSTRPTVQIVKNVAAYPRLPGPLINRQYLSPERKKVPVISVVAAGPPAVQRIQFPHVLRPRDTEADSFSTETEDYEDDYGSDYDSFVRSRISDLLKFSGDEEKNSGVKKRTNKPEQLKPPIE